MAVTTCAWCGDRFVRSGRRRYCSDACKQAHWRGLHASAPAPEALARVERTIYECPSCERRSLGIRRCEECNLFCRRVGPGGSCPHCEEPVAHADLDA
jgi:hypothetical protein